MVFFSSALELVGLNNILRYLTTNIVFSVLSIKMLTKSIFI